METDIIKENERKAALFVSKVMRLSILFLLGTFLLDLLGVFVVDKKVMLVTVIICFILLVIPTIIVDILKIDAPWVKYVIVTLATAMVGVLVVGLRHNIIVVYVYGILMASTFYSKKLEIYTTILATSIFSVCEIIAFNVGAL